MSKKSFKQEYQSLTDDQLVRCIQLRQPESRSALNELLRRHHGDLLRRCHRYLRNWDDAEDAAQETELRMISAIDAFKGESVFRTWLYAIADNQCHTLVARRMRNIMGDHLRSMLLHAAVSSERSQRSQHDQQEMTNMVQHLLKSLPAQAVDILSLRFYADCKMEDIAQILGIGLSAAKMRLYRSLQLAEAQVQFAKN